MSRDRDWTVFFWGAMLLGFALWIIWPGVHGNFYLDDFVNLGGLERVDGTWLAYLSYLLEAPVGGSGRPLSYITFLLQAGSWPESPFDFKVVNLAIHCLNGFLVVALAYLVGRTSFSGFLSNRTILISAAIAGFLLLILPMNMSSVFYVVQRMTLLSAAMVLLALTSYAYLRYRFLTWDKRHYLGATLAVGIGYLGVFAKETAILAGLLVWALEYSVFSRNRKDLSRAWKFLVLFFPFLMVTGYLWLSGKVLGGYAGRDFSLSDRLFSQAVIIFDYLGKIILPTNGRINLYNDGLSFSSWVQNYYLLGVALVGLVVLVVVGFRTRCQLASLGILFFLAGHLLESTFIPLELYFEHRNYLPSVGLIIAIVLGLTAVVSKLRSVNRYMGVMLMLCTVLWGGWVTIVSSVEARTWGDPRAFAVAALTERPESLRARQEMAAYFVAAGDFMGAANLLYSIDEDFGTYSGTYAQLLLLQCFQSDIPLPSKSDLLKIFSVSKFDFGTYVALQDIWNLKRSPDSSCEVVSDRLITQILSALIENPNFQKINNLYVLKSFILADQGDWVSASNALSSIPESRASVPEMILEARFRLYAGNEKEALRGLLKAESELQTLPQKLVYGRYIDQLKEKVERQLTSADIEENSQ